MKTSSVLLISLFIMLYILPLGVRPLIIPDEPRYGEIPREMIASGDWIVPRLNGLRYFEKPVMGYWLNGLSICLFGENAFAVRFPSAMAAGISALMLFALMRRFAPRSAGELSNVSPGILCAAVFLTCFQVYAIGTFSVLDSMLSLFVTAAMFSFFFVYMEDNPGRKMKVLAVFGAFCGFAFLTKGFLAFAVPVVAIAPFMIWEKRWKNLFAIAPIPIAAAVLVSLPWALAIHFKEGDFWHYFFWIEHIKRFTAQDAQHSAPFWFFIPGLLGGALPWTALFPAFISGLKETSFKHPLNRFALCWFVFPFLFFSASSGKLLTYILPCFAPLAILITTGLMSYIESGRKKAFNAGLRVLAGLAAIAAGVLIFNQLTGFPGVTAYREGETWKWLIGTGTLAIWAVMLAVAAKQSEFRKKLVLYCAAPLFLLCCVHFILPVQTLVRKAPGEFLMSHSADIKPDTIIVSHETALHAVCWFYKRNDVYLLVNPGELEYGLSYEDSKHRLLDPKQFGEFVSEHAGKHQVVLISKARDYRRYKDQLPKPASEDDNGGFVFARFSF